MAMDHASLASDFHRTEYHNSLVFWREAFFLFNGTCYKETPGLQVDRNIRAFLTTQLVNPPADCSIKSVRKALAEQVHISDRIGPPCWLRANPAPLQRTFHFANNLGFWDEQTCQISLAGHDRDFFSLGTLGYNYDPAAKCPLWHKFLFECLEGDESRIVLLQEWFGYCLTADTSQHKAMFFIGRGRNGKSVCAGVLKALVGSENCSQTSLGSFNERFSLYPTLHKAINFCDETDFYSKSAEAKIKDFISGDTMTFETKHVPQIYAEATAKLLVMSNNPPRFADKTEAMWERIIIIPWTVMIAAEKRDVRLSRFNSPDWPFLKELPAIFNWSLVGLQRLLERGFFDPPEICELARGHYRTESNPVRQFVEEYALMGSSFQIAATELYSRYRAWAERSGHNALAQNHFSRELMDALPTLTKHRPRSDAEGQERRLVYRGLKLKSMI